MWSSTQTGMLTGCTCLWNVQQCWDQRGEDMAWCKMIPQKRDKKLTVILVNLLEYVCCMCLCMTERQRQWQKVMTRGGMGWQQLYIGKHLLHAILKDDYFCFKKLKNVFLLLQSSWSMNSGQKGRWSGSLAQFSLKHRKWQSCTVYLDSRPTVLIKSIHPLGCFPLLTLL